MTTPSSTPHAQPAFPANIPQHQQQYGRTNNGENSRIVAGYTLQQRLGSGSFATVYKGVKEVSSATSPGHLESQLRPGEADPDTVAVKAITRASEKLTKKVQENLELEISILRTYRHPNIVCLHGVQKTERHFYLILEYCAGGDLQRLIRSRKSGRITERLTRRLMRDLTAGLKFLWGQELIHRDIKPQNLLLTGPLPMDEMNDPSKIDGDEETRRHVDFPSSQFALKIADFGFARHLQTTSLAETLCGSPLYMAPEILQHHRYDAKADLWSAGTVLFEMITGRPPFHGENHIDLLRNIQRKAVRLPPGVQVSSECVTLLRILLNRNPLSRAGFQEFFVASEAFSALGCEGVPLAKGDEGQKNNLQHKMDLGTINETVDEDHASHPSAASMDTINTCAIPENKSPSTPQNTHHAHPLSVPLSQTDQQGPSSSPYPARTLMPNMEQMVHQVHPPFGALTPKTNPGQQQGGNGPRKYTPFTPLEASPPFPPMKALGQMSLAYPPPLVLDSTSPPSPTRQYLIPPKATHQQRMRENSLFAVANTGDQAHYRRPGSSQSSSDDSEFVMVDHGGYRSGPTSPSTSHLKSGDQERQRRTPLQMWNQSKTNEPQTQKALSPPASPRYYNTTQVATPSSNLAPKRNKPRGMLSTSPGTGGALMGLIGASFGPSCTLPRFGGSPSQSHVNIERPDTGGKSHSSGNSFNMEVASKMLSAAEDVGRRAVNVAHLGDTRAYIAMKLLLANEESSSILSSTPMDGVEEEEEDGRSEDGITDNEDSSSTYTPIAGQRRMETIGRRINNSQKSVDSDDDDDEMPFAVSVEEPLQAPTSPVREDAAIMGHPLAASLMNSRTPGRASAVFIQSHFREALSCYLKALTMLKGAVSAAQRVITALNKIPTETEDPKSSMAYFRKRCEISFNWLAGQFSGVLERADAANVEVGKARGPESVVGNGETTQSVTVEELIYNHSLSCGRDGAVKQLLGQYEAARSCYRSAGLLAETLLMEPKLGADDRCVLDEHVCSFAERIQELDGLMLQQSSTTMQHTNSSRRGSSVIGLVGGITSQNKQTYGIVSHANAY